MFSEYWLLTREDTLPPCLGIWQCPDIFSGHSWGGQRGRGVWVEARDAAQHLTMHRTAPPATQIIWPKLPILWLRNPGF